MPPAKPKDTDTPQGPQPRRSNRQRGKQPDGSDNADLANLGRQAPASKDSDPAPKAQAQKPTSPAKPAPSKAKNTRDGHDKERGNSVMPDQRPARPTPTQVTRKTLADVVRGSTSPSDRRPSRRVSRRDVEEFTEDWHLERALDISRKEVRDRHQQERTPRPASGPVDDSEGEEETEDESKGPDGDLADLRGLPAEAAATIKSVIAGLRAEDKGKSDKAEFGHVLRPEGSNGPPGMDPLSQTGPNPYGRRAASKKPIRVK